MDWKEISSWSDIPAIVLFDQFSIHKKEEDKNNDNNNQTHTHTHTHNRLCVCPCVPDREGSMVFASRALVLVVV